MDMKAALDEVNGRVLAGYVGVGKNDVTIGVPADGDRLHVVDILTEDIAS